MLRNDHLEQNSIMFRKPTCVNKCSTFSCNDANLNEKVSIRFAKGKENQSGTLKELVPFKPHGNIARVLNTSSLTVFIFSKVLKHKSEYKKIQINTAVLNFVNMAIDAEE